MPRRKVFHPSSVQGSFWSRDDVQTHLARREIGRLFQAYLGAFPDCTQTQLALLTEHDRADISNWVRGTRQGKVSDIDVLTRIADGLSMPDHARVLLGLAPADLLMGTLRPGSAASAALVDEVTPFTALRRLAICGSRTPDCDQAAIDSTVRELARLVLARRLPVSHGPVGVGIEVMTYIADHYRPPDFLCTACLFGRMNVVRGVDYVIVAGGGDGTQHEIDLARSLGIPVLTIPVTGGTAQRFHDQATRNLGLRPWISHDQLSLLETCSSAEEYVRFIEIVLTLDPGAAP